MKFFRRIAQTELHLIRHEARSARFGPPAHNRQNIIRPRMGTQGLQRHQNRCRAIPGNCFRHSILPELSEKEAAAIPELLHCINDAERISDLALKVYRKTSRVQSSRLSADAIDGIGKIAAKVRAFANLTVDTLKSARADEKTIDDAEQEIHDLAKSTTRLFTLRMKDAGDGSQNDIAVLSVISALRDIARHLGNIAVRVPAIKRG